MSRPALLLVVPVVLLILTGCTKALPGADRPTPADIDPQVVNTNSYGGQCVDDPRRGFVVETSDEDGIRAVSIAANVTVSGAHFVLEEMSVTGIADRTFRLDVTTTEDSGKPAESCSNGGVVPYEVTLELPATDGYELKVWHDGEQVSGFSSGRES